MLASVPGFKVLLGLPATVTRPDLVGWRKWRWEPEVLASVQPSSSSKRSISLIFKGTPRT